MRIAAFVLILCASAASKAQSRTHAVDSIAIRTAIEQGAAAFMRADPDAIMAHYARDIVLSYPGIPDQDFATLTRAYAELRNRPANVSAVTAPTFDEILVSGDLGVVRVRWTTRIRVTATDTTPARESVRHLRDLQIWRRESSGKWMFIRGMHYPDSLPPASDAAGRRPTR